MSSKGILNIIYFIYLHLHVSTFPLCVKIYQVTASMAHQYINILQYNIISRYMKCKIYQSRLRLTASQFSFSSSPVCSAMSSDDKLSNKNGKLYCSINNEMLQLVHYCKAMQFANILQQTAAQMV